MSKIEISRLTFGFDHQIEPLFEEASLTIDTQWKLGLIGRNGRGKTTLLELLLGKYPYKGMITFQETMSYFPQLIPDADQLTYELVLSLANCEVWEIEREVQLLGVDSTVLWRPFSSLSGGEQTKVLLAMLFTEDGTYPLIDEPTNHLDQQGRQQVAEYLNKKKTGFIVVSHDQVFIDTVVDHILAIEKNQIMLYQGNFSVYADQKHRQDALEWKSNEKLKKEVQRLKKTAQEKREWSFAKEKDKLGRPSEKGSGAVYDKGFIGARAARTMKRSKAISGRMEAQVHEKEQLLKNNEVTDELTINWQKSHHQRLLTVERLQLAYEQTALFTPISFVLKEEECIGIIGRNGSGKTALVNAIKKEFLGHVSGSIQIPKPLKISSICQDFEKNRGTLRQFSEAVGLDYSKFLANLHKLGLERKVFDTRIEHMSMGQRKKVEVAKSLSQPAGLYIWDEPLNYLDGFNQEQLVQLLLTVRPPLLLIEHDQVFLNEVATKTIELG